MKCDEKFKKKRSFYNHYYVNHKEKTFKCDMCNMAFAYNSLLKIHLKNSCGNGKRYHTETQNYKEIEKKPQVQDVLDEISSIELSSTDVYTIANVRENGLKDQNIKIELENKLEAESYIKIEESEVDLRNELNEIVESKIDIDEKAYILGI